jgi:hypothetical protein
MFGYTKNSEGKQGTSLRQLKYQEADNPPPSMPNLIQRNVKAYMSKIWEQAVW